MKSDAARFPVQILLADLDGFVPLFGIDDVADFIPSFSGFYEGKPVLARLLIGVRDNFNGVAVLQEVPERDRLSVYPRAMAGTSNVRVDGRTRNPPA